MNPSRMYFQYMVEGEGGRQGKREEGREGEKNGGVGKELIYFLIS